MNLARQQLLFSNLAQNLQAKHFCLLGIASKQNASISHEQIYKNTISWSETSSLKFYIRGCRKSRDRTTTSGAAGQIVPGPPEASHPCHTGRPCSLVLSNRKKYWFGVPRILSDSGIKTGIDILLHENSSLSVVLHYDFSSSCFISNQPPRWLRKSRFI